MKTRQGFVSNSSSSSFIVSAPKGSIPTVMVRVELPVDQVIKTKNQLDKYFLEQWSGEYKTVEEMLGADEYISEQYKECLEEIEKGNVLHIGSVANDDGNPESNMLYEQGIGDCEIEGGGKVIQDCCG